MADSSVTIRVRLTDDGQVKTSLRAVGEQGKAAADQVKAAIAGINFSHATAEANKLSAALSNMARPLSAIGVAFGTFAGTIAAQIASSLAQIPHAFQEIIDKAASTNKEMQDFADQVGSSVEEISGVISGLANFGVAMESVELLLKRLSVTVHEEWPKIAKEVRDASEQQRTDILKVEQAEISLIEATQKAAVAQLHANLAVAQSEHKLAEVQKQASRQYVDNVNREINSATSIRGAQLGLINARVRLHELVTGEQLAPEDRRALEIEQAKLDILEKRQRLFELQVQRERDREDRASRAAQLAQEQESARLADIKTKEDQAIQARKTQMEVATATLNLDKAQGEALERQLNAITRIREEVKTLAEGGTIDRQLTPDQIMRGVIANAASQGAEAIGQFGDSFAEIGAKAPNLLPVLYQLADVFKASGDRALATATLVKLFGRAVSGDLVDAMMEGSEALKAEAAEMKKIGLAATEEDAAVGERYVKSRNRFFAHLQLLKNKIGTEFARFPGFATWDRLLLENQETVRKWAATLGQLFDSVSFALANALTGKPFEQFAAEMRDKMSPEQLLQVKEWQEWFEWFAASARALGRALINVFSGKTFEDFAAEMRDKMSPEELLRVEEWQKSIEKIKNFFSGLGRAIGALYDFFAPLVSAVGDAAHAIGDLFGLGAVAEALAIILAIRLIISLLTVGIPAAAAIAVTAVRGLFAMAAPAWLLTLLAAAGKAGLAGAAALGGGLTVFKAGESAIVDKYKQDLDELNAKFKDKSSAEYAAGLAKIRKEFQEDIKNLESFRDLFGIPKSGAFERLEKELDLLKKITDEKKKIIELDEIIIHDLKIEGSGSDTGRGGGPDNDVLADADATGNVRSFKAQIELAAAAVGGFKVLIDFAAAAIGAFKAQIDVAADKLRQAIINVVEALGAHTTAIRIENDAITKLVGSIYLAVKALDDLATALNNIRQQRQEESEKGPKTEKAPDGETVVVTDRARMSPAERATADAIDRDMETLHRDLEDIKKNTERPPGGGLTEGELRFLIERLRTPGDDPPKRFDRSSLTPDSLFADAERGDFKFSELKEGVAININRLAGDITAFIGEIDQLVRDAERTISAGGGHGGDTSFVGRQTGGMIRGPGTGTSDSILARLSNGEFVMNAGSVARYGVPFMRAVNSGRFALGGLVAGLTSIMPPLGLPRFAEGGMAHAMSNVTIQFPGLPPIGGLRASSDVVDELRKAAVLAQARSGGRKPSRYS